MKATESAPSLGLVCQTTTQDVRFKTISRTQLFALDGDERHARLLALYEHNARRVVGAIEYCRSHAIGLYRLPTGLLPFADDACYSPIMYAPSVAEQLTRAGELARRFHIRIVAHPDQFVVLNSEREQVVANSITILRAQAAVLDAIGMERSPAAAITIHGGKGGRAKALVRELRSLPETVRSRIVIENDERAYGSEAIFQIARDARVPMVFDAHHALVKERLPSYDDEHISAFTAAARQTWPHRNLQLVHISNGREALHDRRHSDFIAAMPASFRNVPYIEVEAKAKELAVFALREWFGVSAGQ